MSGMSRQERVDANRASREARRATPVSITVKVRQAAPALFSQAYFEQMLYASNLQADQFDAQFILDQIKAVSAGDPVDALSSLGLLDSGDVEIEVTFDDPETKQTTKATWIPDDAEDDG